MASMAVATIAILSLLLSVSSYVLANPNATPYESFLQCFLCQPNLSNANLSQIIFTPNTTSYDAVFRSSIRNLRLLSSAAATPGLIVTPTNESHVQAAVLCGRRHGLKLRIRSGGHDYEGLSYVSTTRDPFVVLDLVNLRSISINPDEGTAWVGAGATVGELYYNIGTRNRTAGFPAGVCATVGVGGQFTGGGIGTLMRKYGVAADNIVDALLVNADGRLLNRVSMGEDLFWAIRGGGAASFGVVVAFKVNLVYVPPIVTVFTVALTLSEGATRMVERWQHVAPKLPRDLFIRIMATAVADPAATGNRTIQAGFQGVFLGTQRELLPLMNERFPELGLEAKDCIETSWMGSALYVDGLSRENMTILVDRKPGRKSSFKSKSDFVREPISEKGWEEIWEFLIGAKDETLTMIMDPWGGRLDEIPESKTPFPHRRGNLFNIQYFLFWTNTDEAVAERHLEWMRKLYSFMAPYVSKYPRAAYLNYRDLDLGRNVEGKAFYRDARVWGKNYFKDNFERLAQVKSRVDPVNYFSHEQSIPPFSVC